MDTKTILFTILGSTLLSAIVSGIIALINSKNLKSIEFNYDYRKYILERRKEAYLILENSLKSVIRIYDELKKEEINIERLKRRKDELRQCRIEFSKASDYSIWYSTTMLKHITDLMMTFEKYETDTDEIVNKTYSEKEFLKLQENGSRREWALNIRLTQFFLGDFLKDIVELNDIKKFIKERKENKIIKD
jgi:hypothetical protein